MKKTKFIKHCIRAFLPSLWFNFRNLPLQQAIKMPILIYKPHNLNLVGGVKIEANEVTPGMIRLGFPKSVLFQNNGISIHNMGMIVFKGRCEIGNDSYVTCLNQGKIIFGNGFIATAGLKIVSACGITFGDDVLIGWNNTIIDTNFHPLYNIEKECFDKAYGEINIGDNNWLSAQCFVMHNVNTPPNVIFGARTIVTRAKFESNCVYGGSPIRKLKANVKRIVGEDTIDNYE